ncbi:MAG: polysaccharide pyruvyl transferase WcaK-like protein [Flavobacterium sp.]|jgi:polysaccharide pyruvyl transferase WcaK-like protein
MNKRIVIKGSYGETNFGDDLLMCVLENFFLEKFPNDSIVFMGEKNDYVNKLLKKASFISKNKEVHADMLVYGGGTQFFAFVKEANLYVALVRSLFHLLKTDRIQLYNLILKKLSFRKNSAAVRVSSIGLGLGPFKENSRAEKASELFLQNSNYLAVRDQVSLDYCHKWGLKNAILGADICFSDYLDLKTNTNDQIDYVREKKRIGIIVRDWSHDKEGRAYYNSLLKYAEVYDNDAEVEIQFIIFAPKKDLEWIRILKGKNVLYWDPSNTTVSQFFSKMNDFDSFISSRYHGAIFGALLGKPVICIEIEPKLRILTNQIKELYLWEKPFSVNALVALTPLLEKSVNYEKSISNLRSLSNDMFSDFEQYLKRI